MDRKLWGTDKLVAVFAVGVVAAAGLAAALMAVRHDGSDPVVAGAGQVDASANQKEVVTAPPLKPTSKTATADARKPARGATNAMGAAPVCRNCGVVQLVVAVYGYGQRRPPGYQMHIRMDDGSTRTVQQRGALAAGSRVLVDGDTVRVLAEQPGPA